MKAHLYNALFLAGLLLTVYGWFSLDNYYMALGLALSGPSIAWTLIKPPRKPERKEQSC